MADKELLEQGWRILGLSEVPVSLMDHWTAYLQRRADARVKRANLATMRLGLLPAGWVYGLNDQRQAEYDEQRRILLERHKHLYREPVSGPDGVAAAFAAELAQRVRSSGVEALQQQT